MFLKHYRGYLQADAYVAYDSFFTEPERGLVEVACWAHTRRHSHKALDTDSARMGAGAGLHRAFIHGGETCAAVRHRGPGLAPVAGACVQAGAGDIVRISGKDPRRSVAQERSRPSGRLRAEELDRADALPGRWRSADRQQPHRAELARHRGGTPQLDLPRK